MSFAAHVNRNSNLWCFKLNDKLLSGLGVVMKRRPELDAIGYWEVEMSENGVTGPTTIFEFALDESLDREYLMVCFSFCCCKNIRI